MRARIWRYVSISSVSSHAVWRPMRRSPLFCSTSKTWLYPSCSVHVRRGTFCRLLSRRLSPPAWFRYSCTCSSAYPVIVLCPQLCLSDSLHHANSRCVQPLQLYQLPRAVRGRSALSITNTVTPSTHSTPIKARYPISGLSLVKTTTS